MLRGDKNKQGMRGKRGGEVRGIASRKGEREESSGEVKEKGGRGRGRGGGVSKTRNSKMG